MVPWLLFYYVVLLIRGGTTLQPQTSPTREVLSLDGLWDFSLSQPAKELNHQSLQAAGLLVRSMVVPSSYNDIGTELELRDHVGKVYYQRDFFVPKTWSDKYIKIRFGSVNRVANVSINGQHATTHSVGSLPFETVITSKVKAGQKNTVIVTVDNTLTSETLPQGSIDKLSSGRNNLKYGFDFFSYAGIDRSVVLTATAKTHIEDVTVTTGITGTDGTVTFAVVVKGTETVTTKVTLVDRDGKEVGTASALSGTITVKSAKLWWPFLMDPNPGYLYSLKVELSSSTGLVDSYTQRIGIRTIAWDAKSVKINGKDIYLRGFGKHEEYEIRGRGLDLAMVLRDYNLLKWVGANSFRTAHYPYSEEVMDLADELGILVINESPAANLNGFGKALLANHETAMKEFIQRDKNRPSVIMWGIAHEPQANKPLSDDYFKQLTTTIRSLDKTRPLTISFNDAPEGHTAGKYIDVISLGTYTGWFGDSGDVDVIVKTTEDLVKSWRSKYNLPIMITEYGPDSQEGLHFAPAYIWSEEYQNLMISQYFEAFDNLRKTSGYFIGEMLWNLADIKTSQDFTRVGGNRKGIFSRNRQPKSSAHLVRKRYWNLALHIDKVTPPSDLDDYSYGNGQ